MSRSEDGLSEQSSVRLQACDDCSLDEEMWKEIDKRMKKGWRVTQMWRRSDREPEKAYKADVVKRSFGAPAVHAIIAALTLWWTFGLFNILYLSYKYFGDVEYDAVYSQQMTSGATFQVFRDDADEWRWRLVATNGNIIADSGEGYRSKQGVERGVESVKQNAPGATVQFAEE